MNATRYQSLCLGIFGVLLSAHTVFGQNDSWINIPVRVDLPAVQAAVDNTLPKQWQGTIPVRVPVVADPRVEYDLQREAITLALPAPNTAQLTAKIVAKRLVFHYKVLFAQGHVVVKDAHATVTTKVTFRMKPATWSPEVETVTLQFDALDAWIVITLPFGARIKVNINGPLRDMLNSQKRGTRATNQGRFV